MTIIDLAFVLNALPGWSLRDNAHRDDSPSPLGDGRLCRVLSSVLACGLWRPSAAVRMVKVLLPQLIPFCAACLSR